MVRSSAPHRIQMTVVRAQKSKSNNSRDVSAENVFKLEIEWNCDLKAKVYSENRDTCTYLVIFLLCWNHGCKLPAHLHRFFFKKGQKCVLSSVNKEL